MHWSQNATSVPWAIHPVMSLFPHAAHVYSDTAHAPVRGTCLDFSGLFQPQQGFSVLENTVQTTGKVKCKVAVQNASLNLFIVRVEGHNVTLSSSCKSLYIVILRFWNDLCLVFHSQQTRPGAALNGQEQLCLRPLGWPVAISKLEDGGPWPRPAGSPHPWEGGSQSSCCLQLFA